MAQLEPNVWAGSQGAFLGEEKCSSCPDFDGWFSSPPWHPQVLKAILALMGLLGLALPLLNNYLELSKRKLTPYLLFIEAGSQHKSRMFLGCLFKRWMTPENQPNYPCSVTCYSLAIPWSFCCQAEHGLGSALALPRSLGGHPAQAPYFQGNTLRPCHLWSWPGQWLPLGRACLFDFPPVLFSVLLLTWILASWASLCWKLFLRDLIIYQTCERTRIPKVQCFRSTKPTKHYILRHTNIYSLSPICKAPACLQPSAYRKDPST